MSRSSRRVRWLYGGLVSLLGILAFALPAADLSPRVPDPWGPETFMGDLAVVGLAVPLVVGGGWLAMRDWEPRHMRSVVVRTYVATIAAGVLAGWATVLWVTGDPTQYVVAIDGVLIAALLTFSTSVLSAEETRVAEANREGEAAARELAEEVIDCSTDPTLIVDADDEVRWLNEAAAAVFGVDAETAIGRDRDAVVGGALAPAGSAGDVSCCTEYRARGGDRFAHRFACQRHDIDEGLHAGGRIEQYTDVTEERNAVEALETIGALTGSSEDVPDDLLDAGRELLDAEYAAFTRVDGDRTEEVVRSERVDPTGDDPTPPLHERAVREVRDAGAVRTGYRRSEGDGATGGFEFDHGAASFDAFVAAPAESDGDVVGVVTFMSRSADSFTGWERALAELLAEWIEERTANERYERALEHERERLEFVNRIVRHNILNGLNLVNARVEHLADDVDGAESAEHLSVVQRRVDDMADLIDTIRAFMDAALSRRDHALEPVPARATLEEKLSLAAETYDASLRVHDLPDEETRVVADELAGEVFENVLSNAVEHNDRDEPTVEVWTSRSTDRLPPAGDAAPESAVGGATALGDGGERPEEGQTLTVHVADDGPGIDEEQKRRLLRHGDAELDDTGHGFGFYLVREMMESYGGGVRIRDNQPRGTVIDLVFPIADA